MEGMRVLSLQRHTQRGESGIIILGKFGLVRSVSSDRKVVTRWLTASMLNFLEGMQVFDFISCTEETFLVLSVLFCEYKVFVPFTSVDPSSVYGRWWSWDSGKSSDHRAPACKGDVGAPFWTWGGGC